MAAGADAREVPASHRFQDPATDGRDEKRQRKKVAQKAREDQEQSRDSLCGPLCERPRRHPIGPDLSLNLAQGRHSLPPKQHNPGHNAEKHEAKRWKYPDRLSHQDEGRDFGQNRKDDDDGKGKAHAQGYGRAGMEAQRIGLAVAGLGPKGA